MTTGYQIKEQTGLHYLTFQVVDWVDIFTRKIYRDIVIESLIYCQQKKELQIFGFVIMSNHIHLILNSISGKLSDTVRDIKKFTSSEIIKEVINNPQESRKEWMLNRFSFKAQQHSRNEKYQFWTHENHSIFLYSPKFTQEKLDYIHDNPVRAGIVEKPEDYLYSSARNYAELDSVLEIVKLNKMLKTY